MFLTRMFSLYVAVAYGLYMTIRSTWAIEWFGGNRLLWMYRIIPKNDVWVLVEVFVSDHRGKGDLVCCTWMFSFFNYLQRNFTHAIFFITYHSNNWTIVKDH